MGRLLVHLGRPLWQRLLLGLAFLLGPALPAWAQSGATATCPPTAEALSPEAVRQGLLSAQDRGFLWQARRDGRVLWLYGTVHAAQRQWMFPGPAVLDAVKASDQLALELDLLDPAIASRLQAAVAARPGEAALPQALQQRLKAQAAQACVGDALSRLRPEMQAMSLVALAGRRDGLDPAYGIDGFLGGLARGLGKPVISLETPEAQIQALVQDSLPLRDQLVDETLAELERGETVPGLLRLTRAWADGRLDELENYGQWCRCLDTEQQRAFHARLVEGRNAPLTRRVVALHEAGRSVFVAVGALHMVGASGLPAALAREGFEVRRIPLGAGAPR